MKITRSLTGDRPTGKLHLGHFVGSIQNRLLLQDRDNIEARFYMVADIQALTDNYSQPEKVRENVNEVIIDNLACGLDPEKNNFFIQSTISEIAELTVIFLNLVTLNRLLENPTVRTEILSRGWNIDKLMREDNADNIYSDRPGVPAGFVCYPVSQAADILFVRSNLIPVGEDQRPMIELANEISSNFNRIYNVELFSKVKILVGSTPRLMGLDGNAKMSKSLNNSIFLSDSREEIIKKVKSAYTCPSKIHITDKVSDNELAGNMVFKYLEIFDTNYGEIASLKEKYKNGEIGDTIGKERLIEVLDLLLDPIRKRRVELENEPEYITEIIKNGTEITKKEAKSTLNEVKKALKINYS